MDAVSAKTPWGAVDPRRLAAALEPVSRLVVERANVGPGDRVLDVGCGTGNAALLAAKRGCIVSAVDNERRSLEIADARATEQGLKISLSPADAVALPYSNASFSIVMSVFGVMYAFDQERAARELARVCTSGGRVILAAWAPMSFYSRLGIVLDDYLSSPPPSTSPVQWGWRPHVERLLNQAGITITDASPKTLTLTFADLDVATSFLIDTGGHVAAERQRLKEEDLWQNLVDDIRDLVARQDTHVGPGVTLNLEYLLTTGHNTTA